MAGVRMSSVNIARLMEALSMAKNTVTVTGKIAISIRNHATTKSRNSDMLDRKLAILAVRRRLHFAEYHNLCRKLQQLFRDGHDGESTEASPLVEAGSSTNLDNLKATATNLSRRTQEANDLMSRCDEAHAKALNCDRRIAKLSKIRHGKSNFPQPVKTFHENISLESQAKKTESGGSDNEKCSKLEDSVPKQDFHAGNTFLPIKTLSIVPQAGVASNHLGESRVISSDDTVSPQSSALTSTEYCLAKQAQGPATLSASPGSNIKTTELTVSPVVTTVETTPALFSPPAHYGIIAPNMIDPREPQFLPRKSVTEQLNVSDTVSSNKKCRAIMILDIPKSIAPLASILSRIRGGMITRATFATLGSQWRFHESDSGQNRQESCRMAYIEFAQPHHAEAYVNYMNDEHNQLNKAAMFGAGKKCDITKSQQDVQIRLAGTPSYPLPISTQHAIQEQGSTRNITVSFEGYTVSTTCNKIEKCIDLLARRFQGPSPFKSGRGWGMDALFEDICVEHELSSSQVRAYDSCGPSTRYGLVPRNRSDEKDAEESETDNTIDTEQKAVLLLHINFLRIEHAIKAMSALRYNVVLMPPTSEEANQQDRGRVTIDYSTDKCSGPLDELRASCRDGEKGSESTSSGESGARKVSILQTCRSAALSKTVEDLILGRERSMDFTVDGGQDEVDLLGLNDLADTIETTANSETSAASSPSIWSHFSVESSEEDMKEIEVRLIEEDSALGEAGGQKQTGNMTKHTGGTYQ